MSSLFSTPLRLKLMVGLILPSSAEFLSTTKAHTELDGSTKASEPMLSLDLERFRLEIILVKTDFLEVEVSAVLLLVGAASVAASSWIGCLV